MQKSESKHVVEASKVAEDIPQASLSPVHHPFRPSAVGRQVKASDERSEELQGTRLQANRGQEGEWFAIQIMWGT